MKESLKYKVSKITLFRLISVTFLIKITIVNEAKNKLQRKKMISLKCFGLVLEISTQNHVI